VVDVDLQVKVRDYGQLDLAMAYVQVAAEGIADLIRSKTSTLTASAEMECLSDVAFVTGVVCYATEVDRCITVECQLGRCADSRKSIPRGRGILCRDANVNIEGGIESSQTSWT